MDPAAGTSDRLQIRASKRLGTFALQCDVDLPLAGVTALFGTSGSGKSTLMNLVAGLHRPDTGRIAVGTRVFHDSEGGIDVPVEQRALGVVFQDDRLFPHFSVRQNLLFGLNRAGERARHPRIAPDKVIALLGIGALLQRRPHTLSGGERQRVAIGRALLAQPRLLLMDEPLAALDAPRKAELLPYIEQLRDEFDLPILYVSHAADEVLRLARTLIVLDCGRVVAAGPLDDALRQPQVTRLFPAFDAGSVVRCVVQGHDERFGLTVLAVEAGVELRVPRIDFAPGTRLRVRVPARDVAIALSQPVDVSTVNRLPGSVAEIEALDQSHVEVRIDVGSSTRLRARVTREATERLALIPGLSVWCLIKSVALDRAALLLEAGEIRPPCETAPAANDAQVAPPR
jgi:molybdate transport system ATP-binding protein